MPVWTMALTTTRTAGDGPRAGTDPAGSRLRASACSPVAATAWDPRAAQVPARCPREEKQSSEDRRPR